MRRGANDAPPNDDFGTLTLNPAVEVVNRLKGFDPAGGLRPINLTQRDCSAIENFSNFLRHFR
jgi:hypothetical protein